MGQNLFYLFLQVIAHTNAMLLHGIEYRRSWRLNLAVSELIWLHHPAERPFAGTVVYFTAVNPQGKLLAGARVEKMENHKHLDFGSNQQACSH